MKFNQYLDYNEKNFGLEKLRAKYPELPEDKIYEKVLGRPLKFPKHLSTKVKN